jgi:hypothetical protein
VAGAVLVATTWPVMSVDPERMVTKSSTTKGPTKLTFHVRSAATVDAQTTESDDSTTPAPTTPGNRWLAPEDDEDEKGKIDSAAAVPIQTTTPTATTTTSAETARMRGGTTRCAGGSLAYPEPKRSERDICTVRRRSVGLLYSMKR